MGLHFDNSTAGNVSCAAGGPHVRASWPSPARRPGPVGDDSYGAGAPCKRCRSGFDSRRLHAPLAQRQSDGFLIRRFGVQVPGGALIHTLRHSGTGPCSSAGPERCSRKAEAPVRLGSGARYRTARDGPDAGPYLGTFTRRVACRSRADHVCAELVPPPCYQYPRR
jgi:hypothetical protein